ncbi:MAG: hypothetical protein JW829_15490 [Pirellulales bacterium]|nr:hypothetical protein [Pirellulales bacterium]
MDQYEINSQKILLVMLLAIILTAVVVVGLQAFYYFYTSNLATADTNGGLPTKFESILAAQETSLTDYRILDQEKGTVAIPISRAMELVVDELSHSEREVVAPNPTHSEAENSGGEKQ